MQCSVKNPEVDHHEVWELGIQEMQFLHKSDVVLCFVSNKRIFYVTTKKKSRLHLLVNGDMVNVPFSGCVTTKRIV